MFAQYSKFVLIATVATSCFLMSCQKAGDRGVKAQTANGKAEPAKKDETKAKEGSELDTTISNPPKPAPKGPTSSDNTQVTSGDNSRVTSGDNSGVTSGDNSRVTSGDNSRVTSGDNSRVTSGDNSRVTSGDNSRVTSGDNSKITSADNSKVEVKACTEEMKNTALAIKATSATKEDDTKSEKIKKLTASLAACEKVEKLLADAKIESCVTKVEEKDRTLSVKATQDACNNLGMALKDLDKKENKYATAYVAAEVAKVKVLKADKLVVSDAAKELFDDKNSDLKMYLVNGALKSDSSELLKLYSEGKVACGITSTASDITHNLDTSMSLKVTKIIDMNLREEKVLLNGISMEADLELGSKSDSKVEITKKSVVLSCLNINIKKLDVAAVRKALGAHMAVETKKVEVKK